jgi:ribosomal protein S27E
MANANAAEEGFLPLRCPRCDHDRARLSVNSYTILTVICPNCSHTWSAEMAVLPDSVRRRFRLVPPAERSAENR